MKDQLFFRFSRRHPTMKSEVRRWDSGTIGTVGRKAVLSPGFKGMAYPHRCRKTAISAPLMRALIIFSTKYGFTDMRVSLQSPIS